MSTCVLILDAHTKDTAAVSGMTQYLIISTMTLIILHKNLNLRASTEKDLMLTKQLLRTPAWVPDERTRLSLQVCR